MRFLLCAVLGAGAFVQEDPDHRKIEDAVRRLSAPDAARRDEAFRELEKFGEKAIPHLKPLLEADHIAVRELAVSLVARVDVAVLVKHFRPQLKEFLARDSIFRDEKNPRVRDEEREDRFLDRVIGAKVRESLEASCYMVDAIPTEEDPALKAYLKPFVPHLVRLAAKLDLEGDLRQCLRMLGYALKKLGEDPREGMYEGRHFQDFLVGFSRSGRPLLEKAARLELYEIGLGEFGRGSTPDDLTDALPEIRVAAMSAIAHWRTGHRLDDRGARHSIPLTGEQISTWIGVFFKDHRRGEVPVGRSQNELLAAVAGDEASAGSDLNLCRFAFSILVQRKDAGCVDAMLARAGLWERGYDLELWKGLWSLDPGKTWKRIGQLLHDGDMERRMSAARFMTGLGGPREPLWDSGPPRCGNMTPAEKAGSDAKREEYEKSRAEFLEQALKWWDARKEPPTGESAVPR